MDDSADERNQHTEKERGAVSRVLVFNVPAHGHVNPTLPVVAELVARGEQVVYYLTEEFEPQIRRIGADFRRIEGTQVGFGPPPGADAGGLSDPATVMRTMAAFFPRMMAQGLRLVPQLVDRVRAEDADLVVYTPLCPWGRALSEALGLPAVKFSPTYATNEHSPLVRRLSSVLEEPSPEAEEAMGDFRDASRDLRDRYGLGPLRITDPLSYAEALNVVALPRRFQPDADAFDERYVFVGPCVSPRGDTPDFPSERLAGRPTLYISLGTVFAADPGFFSACFEAFADSGWEVVLSIGTRTDPATMGRVPGNFLVRPHVPQLEVLEHADVFVTHGGMNSVMEAAYYGVPMVVAPQQPEQAMTAARVAELGLGVALEPGEVTAGALRHAVATVGGDPGYKGHAADLREAARDAGGYRRAADAIQQFGRRRRRETGAGGA